jgi:zinc finger SWIM domain-containing protein 3
MTDGQKADAVGYGIGGLRTHQIMNVMEHQAGGQDKLGFIPRDLYNFVAEYKKKKIEGRDAEYMLNYMASQKDKDADFFYRYTTDKDKHLRNIFWADAQSRLDYEAFGGVLVFDSTYRVNRYNLPFVPFVGVNHHRSTTVFGCAVLSDETTKSYIWLLESFLMAMRQKHPRSLITDGDHAMGRAIYVVMPDAFHRLCSWHIEQNMLRHLRKEKLKDFRKLIYERMEVEEFERRWAEYMQQYGFSEKDTWLMRMYDLREKWSAAYTKDGYFLRMRSNQRSESLNSGLHNHLDRMMSMVDLLEHSQFYKSRIRRNERENDAKASQSVPFTELKDDPLLKSAARIYTPVMFKMVKEQFVKSAVWEISETTQEDAILVRFVVSSEWGKHDVRCVFGETSLESVNCHCRKMEREDIPCAHVFRVLKHCGMRNIPSCCVAVRWTMQAKLAFEPESIGNTHVWSEQMDRYRELRNMANTALFKASMRPDESQRVIEFFKSISYEDAENDDENDENADAAENNDNNMSTTFGPLPAYFSGANQSFTGKVLDPIPIKPKGAPCKKRPKSYHERFSSSSKRYVHIHANFISGTLCILFTSYFCIYSRRSVI